MSSTSPMSPDSGMPEERPPKYARKPRPSGVTLWNETQKAWLLARDQAHKDIVVSLDLEFKSDRGDLPPAYRKWVNDTADEALAHPAFQNLDMVHKSRDDWKKSLTSYFKNNRIRKINKKFSKRAAEGALVAKHAEAGRSRDGQPRLTVSEALQGMAQLRAPTPKEIFKSEKEEVIREEVGRLATTISNPAARYQKAWATTWNAVEDKSLYDRRDAPLEDVVDNQKLFGEVLCATFHDICQSGALGNTEVTILTGWRDRDNQLDLRTFEFSSRDYAGASDKFLKHDGAGSKEAIHKQWDEWCQAKIANNIVIPPGTNEPQVDSRLALNSDGIPVFSGVLTDTISPSDLRVMLESLYVCLWYRFHKNSNILWGEIEKYSSLYFDHSKFTLPVPFRRPSSLDNTEVVSTVEYLRQLKKDDPFLFFDPSESMTYFDSAKEDEFEIGNESKDVDDAPNSQAATTQATLDARDVSPITFSYPARSETGIDGGKVAADKGDDVAMSRLLFTESEQTPASGDTSGDEDGKVDEDDEGGMSDPKCRDKALLDGFSLDSGSDLSECDESDDPDEQNPRPPPSTPIKKTQKSRKTTADLTYSPVKTRSKRKREVEEQVPNKRVATNSRGKHSANKGARNSQTGSSSGQGGRRGANDGQNEGKGRDSRLGGMRLRSRSHCIYH
ncbi:hypothetical protein PM082_023000 [Marasmius tenuissimus]|nr:hypothetical protein PM082_023000 [Marasmius tenuissimus]